MMSAGVAAAQIQVIAATIAAPVVATVVMVEAGVAVTAAAMVADVEEETDYANVLKNSG